MTTPTAQEKLIEAAEKFSRTYSGNEFLDPMYSSFLAGASHMEAENSELKESLQVLARQLACVRELRAASDRLLASGVVIPTGEYAALVARVAKLELHLGRVLNHWQEERAAQGHNQSETAESARQALSPEQKEETK